MSQTDPNFQSTQDVVDLLRSSGDIAKILSRKKLDQSPE